MRDSTNNSCENNNDRTTNTQTNTTAINYGEQRRRRVASGGGSDESRSSPVSSPYYSGFVGFVGGSLGGVATVAVGQPLDTVKVKMQTFPKLYTNLYSCFKTTLKNDGVFRGLYAGTVPSLAANVAENAVLFCAYGYCQKAVSLVTGRYGDSATVLDKATSGFFAAFFSSFVLCPTELIKCKLQAQNETKNLQQSSNKNNSHMTATKLTRHILKTQGFLGLFNGFSSTLFREMPGYFAFFGGIATAKHLLTTYTPLKDETHPLTSLIAGGCGGMCLWTAIFPFDLVKSRIQVEDSKLSMTQMISKIVREEGFKKLYNGLTPTLIRTFPATAALLYTVDKTNELLL